MMALDQENEEYLIVRQVNNSPNFVQLIYLMAQDTS
jgi:hypothetical protein